MDSKEKKTSTKPKSKFVKNLDSKECVRPFKLQRHYPSTLTQLRKNEMKKSSAITQVLGATNVDLSDNIKIISTQDVQPSEMSNVKKLKLTTMSRKDLGIKLNMQDGKFQTKVLTMPKIIQNSSRFKKLAEPSVQELQREKPKIKNISQVLTLSPSKEQHINSDNLFPSNTTIQVINSEPNLALNPTENCSQQIIFQNSNSNVLGQMVAPNVIYNTQQNSSQYVTLKSLSGFSNFVMVQNDNGQLVTPTLGNLKPVTIVKQNSTLNNQGNLKNSGKVIIQAQLNNASSRKRDSSLLDQASITEIKKYCNDVGTDNLATSNIINNSTISKESEQSLEIKNSLNQNANATVSKKNIMVIVPNETAKELSMVSSSSNTIDENFILDNSEIPIIHEKNLTESNDSDNDMQVSNQTKIVSNHNEDEAESNISSTNTHKSTPSSKSENTLDKFSILRKAVLSVQDENLRAEALKALQDCGIKTKKKVFIKRPLPTKIINESAVQTNVFSLLKEGEFLEADETHEDLIRIKSNRKFPKTSINTLGATSKNKLHMDEAEYAKELDNMLDNRFRNNKNVSDVKNAFTQNQKLKAKYMLEKLEKDFEASKNYDSDGYLGIHRAVINDNLQDVQKQIILLKATKQNIDVCTVDGQVIFNFFFFIKLSKIFLIEINAFSFDRQAWNWLLN